MDIRFSFQILTDLEVDEIQYLKELVRYIHLNPVKAGLTKLPDQYLWSSHRAYMLFSEYLWLTKNKVLSYFEDPAKLAIQYFSEFIQKGIGIEEKYNFEIGDKNGVLGNDEFLKKVIEPICIKTNTKIELPDLIVKVCKKYSITEEELISYIGHFYSNIRAVLALLVRESGYLSLEKLARYLKKESSGLSKLATRLQQKTIGSSLEEITQLRNEVFIISNS